ncbi:hypothetical protein LTR50_006082 [Elasticomyces elasticus]|nr:hypothetical protein LTR50_006082 [Elasticomyces elasticus]
MKNITFIFIALAVCGTSAYPSVIVNRSPESPPDWKNKITTGDLADGKLANLPKAGHQVQCETRDHSNDNIFKAASYAHHPQKSKSPTKKPQKPNDPKSKFTPYPHQNSPEKSKANKIKNADFKLEKCDPGSKHFIEYPILENGSLWTDGATDPGPDRILIQYIDDTTAAYCGTVFHFPAGNGRSSAFELCKNSDGGHLKTG